MSTTFHVVWHYGGRVNGPAPGPGDYQRSPERPGSKMLGVYAHNQGSSASPVIFVHAAVCNADPPAWQITCGNQIQISFAGDDDAVRHEMLRLARNILAGSLKAVWKEIADEKAPT